MGCSRWFTQKPELEVEIQSYLAFSLLGQADGFETHRFKTHSTSNASDVTY